MATVSRVRGPLHPEPSALDAVRAFRALAAPLRFRVIRDPEGWPVIPGKLGRLEWHDGAEVAVYTDRPRLFARLWAVPEVRRWQVGDQEVRGLVRLEALPAVAGLIQARRRRRANAGSFPTHGIAPLQRRRSPSDDETAQRGGARWNPSTVRVPKRSAPRVARAVSWPQPRRSRVAIRCPVAPSW